MIEHTMLSRRDDAFIKLVGTHQIVTWSEEPIKFKSGIESHVYVNGRNDVTGSRAALRGIGGVIADLAYRAGRSPGRRLQLIGIPTAGTALAAAAVSVAQSEFDIGCRTMREVKKAHGKGENQRWVDGFPQDDEDYASVDNVVTDGQSKLDAIERLREDGYPVEQMLHIILIDRKQGGIEKLNALGYRTATRMDLPTVVRGLVLMGFWPKERLERYLAERAEWADKLGVSVF